MYLYIYIYISIIIYIYSGLSVTVEHNITISSYAWLANQINGN